MARHRINIALWAVAILGLAGHAVANESIYKRVLPATAWIITPTGKGSGVLVDMERKLVATNFHIVELHSEVTVVFPVRNGREVVVEKDHYRKNLSQLSVKAKVKLRDPLRDLALIELEEIPDGATALELAPFGALPGQTVHSIGNPGASEALWVYSTGSIRQSYSRRFVMDGQVIDGRVVETQTPINPGDSGGPVVNDAGQLVALTCAFRPNSSLFGICIDVSELKDMLQGNIKSIDRQVASALRELGLKYVVNPVGDYVFEVPTEGGRQLVIVKSVTWPKGPIRVRQVFSVVPLPTGGLSAELSMRFLKQNGFLIFGSWEYAHVDGKACMVYRTIVPVTSEPEMLRTALNEAITVAASARKELAAIEAQQKLLSQDKS